MACFGFVGWSFFEAGAQGELVVFVFSFGLLDGRFEFVPFFDVYQGWIFVESFSRVLWFVERGLFVYRRDLHCSLVDARFWRTIFTVGWFLSDRVRVVHDRVFLYFLVSVAGFFFTRTVY